MYWTLLILAAILCGCGASQQAAPKIGLTAERKGDSIRVRWNGGLTATSAELRIADSSHLEVLPVDPALLAFGSVLYIARSADVRFDLDLRVNGKQHIVDTVRLIDPGRAASRPEPPVIGTVAPEVKERGRRSRETSRTTDFRLPPRDLRQIPPPRR